MAERTKARVALLGWPATVAVTAMAATTLLLIFLLQGAALYWTIIPLLVVMMALAIMQGFLQRGEARTFGWPQSVFQFAFLWGWWSGSQMIISDVGPRWALWSGAVFAVILSAFTAFQARSKRSERQSSNA